MEMMKAKPLKAGDVVGLIAPSSPVEEARVAKAKAALESFGLQVLVGETCYAKYGYLSGTDELRSSELNQMFSNSALAGIICLRGGYGIPRILDRIDYEMIRNNPKVFVGFSDITALHTAIQQQTGLITFHGPMANSMIDNFSEYSRKSWEQVLFGKQEKGLLANPTGEILEGWRAGRAKGRLCGGNLSLIADTMGTPYELDTAGKILFIEEIGEAPYQIDRMLTELRLAGKLSEAAGIILGDFADCTPTKAGESLTLEEVFFDLLPYDKPILRNLRAGHCDPHMTLPMGALYEIDGEQGILALLEEPLQR